MMTGGDICYSPIEHIQMLRAVSDQMWEYGMILLISGFIIGYVTPKIATWIRMRYGRAPE
jgi:hypothetical protein